MTRRTFQPHEPPRGICLFNYLLFANCFDFFCLNHRSRFFSPTARCKIISKFWEPLINSSNQSHSDRCIYNDVGVYTDNASAVTRIHSIQQHNKNNIHVYIYIYILNIASATTAVRCVSFPNRARAVTAITSRMRECREKHRRNNTPPPPPPRESDYILADIASLLEIPFSFEIQLQSPLTLTSRFI